MNDLGKKNNPQFRNHFGIDVTASAVLTTNNFAAAVLYFRGASDRWLSSTSRQ